ncbi:glycosyltransferase [Winogradskyella immobilis]|uniref:Glycosyltransferase n=1 Tax=Winogradskyella immobilis TaxID=2816852 RepID=A0ABS8ENW9_9FLAO|nr:glycosyltransferase [Winogradskyella immobilis]MCC1484893.1 glycosyltransferase [Winogradskyella immobilis]MCG0016985.1 glycosyltransferase [Winogradskyella immobilis]
MTKKTRVLYTIPNFDTAGSGKVLYDLAKGLDKTKFEVIIACTHNKGAFFKEVEDLGLPMHIIDATVPLRPYFSLISRVKPFKLFLKEQSIDIVHSWHWSSDWSEVLASRFANAKFVFTKKAMSWGNMHWKLRSFLSHFIITVNTEMKMFFPYKKQQQLIPFGLDTAYYNSDLFLKDDDCSVFKIITVANLVAVKGIETLVRAIKNTQKSDIFLKVIGDDKNEYANYLKNLVKGLGLENQISFLGKENDVRSFLAQADLYIIPSKKEGMPMALIEAMAMQVPVLGSNIPGIHYILKDFENLLFEVENDDMLSEKILMMYHKSSEERTTIGKELRNYSEVHFSLNSFISAHETLYSNLARNR